MSTITSNDAQCMKACLTQASLLLHADENYAISLIKMREIAERDEYQNPEAKTKLLMETATFLINSLKFGTDEKSQTLKSSMQQAAIKMAQLGGEVLPNKDKNPYHGVAHTIDCMCNVFLISQHEPNLTAEDRAELVLTALGHDFGHPGGFPEKEKNSRLGVGYIEKHTTNLLEGLAVHTLERGSEDYKVIPARLRKSHVDDLPTEMWHRMKERIFHTEFSSPQADGVSLKDTVHNLYKEYREAGFPEDKKSLAMLACTRDADIMAGIGINMAYTMMMQKRIASEANRAPTEATFEEALGFNKFATLNTQGAEKAGALANKEDIKQALQLTMDLQAGKTIIPSPIPPKEVHFTLVPRTLF
jgi:hypothetical protein